jgi:hypothetical protein
MLQRPLTWQAFSVALSEAMKGNASQLLAMTQGSALQDLQRSAVSCNDQASFPPPSAEEVVDESIEVLKTVSRFAMSVMTSEPDSGCHYWPVTPPERYTGPWNHTLKNRVLIHSNLVCALKETLNVCLIENSWILSRLCQVELLLRRYWVIRLRWY